MKNQEIAKIVAKMVYEPKKSNKDPMFAIQILVEKLFIPEDLNFFGLEEIETYLLLALESKDKEKELIDGLQN